MKKLLPALLLIAIISACKTPNYTIGMSETEFKSHNKMITSLVEATPGRTVYKQLNAVNNGHNSYLYYYFVDGKLARIDEGERRVIIQHVNN